MRAAIDVGRRSGAVAGGQRPPIGAPRPASRPAACSTHTRRSAGVRRAARPAQRPRRRARRAASTSRRSPASAIAFTPRAAGSASASTACSIRRLGVRLRGRALRPVLAVAASERCPPGAALMLDPTGLDRAAPRLLGAGAAGGSPALGRCCSRLGTALAGRGRRTSARRARSLFDGETAVAIAPGAGRPALRDHRPRRATSTARATAAGGARGPAGAAVPAPASGPGQAPVFTDQQVDGITAHQLALAPGLELDYAVFDGKLVIVDQPRRDRRRARRTRDR